MRPGLRPRFAGSLHGRAMTATLALGSVYLAGLAIAGLSASPRVCGLAVVFGNTVDAGGQPSPRLAARLGEALALYHAGIVRRLMVSGGIEQPGNRDEARAMALWLMARGVPSAAIIEDSRGTDTMETACHAAAVAKGGNAVAVTQWFHLPRAMPAMRRFGIRGVSGAWPRFLEARDAYSLLREAIALPFYAIRSLVPGAGSLSAATRMSPT